MLKLLPTGKSDFYVKRTPQKSFFYLINYVQFSRNWQFLQHLIRFHLIFYQWNRSKKVDLESTIKFY